MHNRLEVLRNILEEEELNGLVISSRPNTFYYTGFTGTTSMCLVTRESAFLVVDFRYVTQAGEQAFPGIEVIEYDKDVNDTLNLLCTHNRVESLGIEGEDISFSKVQLLRKSLNEVKSLKDVQACLRCIRMIKDPDEIMLIQKAADIADKAFQEILSVLKPGVRECEAALELEYRMKKLGASGVSFETIVASGPRSALPHGVAGMRQFAAGDAVVMDFGAIYRGYCSDMTRTVFLGNPSMQLKEIYDIVLWAQTEALDKAAEGMTGAQLDRTAREIIDSAGYEKYFGHGLGHGVGIEIHEMPRISPKGEDVLKKGMVFTVEPGIYVEGVGGVRIEDMVVLGESEAKILTKSTKELLVL
ncbi:MAG: aminopeptidase P family protein [Ruminiclostridium sp.]|nr:aminopeptidase P family protein [Ruminiclostridium sp.]